MADARGRNPGEPGYDGGSDPNNATQYNTGGALVPGTPAADPNLVSGGPPIKHSVNPSVPMPFNGTSPAPPASSAAPHGGSLTDRNYVASLVQYYGSQPGADPSLSANPDYWINQIMSGHLGTDENYIVNKMQTAWKDPAGANGAVDPSYLSPFGNQGDLNAKFGSNPPQAGGFTPFQGPGDFKAPTAQSILDDPSYTFARDQAIDAVSKNTAAQGLYNSGGTIFDLANLGGNIASQQFDNIWNRDFGKWNTDWTHALDAYNANQGGQSQNYNQSLTAYQNARDTYFANQNNPFSKLSTLASLGAGAASNAG